MALDPNDKRVLAIKSFACEALEIDDVDFDDALNEELTLVKDFVDNMWKERWQPMLVYKVTEVDAINGSVTKVRFAYPAGRDSSINMPDASRELHLVFFMHTTDGAIPATDDFILDDYALYGVINGSLLTELVSLIRDSFMPVILARRERSMATSYAEAQVATTKFAAQVSQLVSDANRVRLTDPVPIADPAKIDNNTLNAVSAVVKEWTAIIQNQLDTLGSSTIPPEEGPAAELQLWRGREAGYIALRDQLRAPEARVMVEVLSHEKDDIVLHNYDLQQTELQKRATEAADNVKFLSTLEHHFKVLAADDLQVVADSMLTFFTSVKMVWVISRHYNTDDRMVPLLERCALLITRRVAEAVTLDGLLNLMAAGEFEEAAKLVNDAKTCLDKWSSSYQHTRKAIEQKGSQRWEFDRVRLFSRTKFMSARCKELADIIDRVRRFSQLDALGALGGAANAPGLQTLQDGMNSLLEPLVDFSNDGKDPFNNKDKAAWEAALEMQEKQATAVQAAADAFIDTTFQRIKSVDAAINLLDQCTAGDTANSVIAKNIGSRFDDIVDQLADRIVRVKATFDEQTTSPVGPPIDHWCPPVSGAIHWTRRLITEVQEPYRMLEALSDAKMARDGAPNTKMSTLKASFVALQADFKRYEDGLFLSWSATATEVIDRNLQRPILTFTDDRKTADPWTREIAVNFSDELRAVIKETKTLDRLSFRQNVIPELAQNITLRGQESFRLVDALTAMVDRYRALLDSMPESITKLLRTKLVALHSIMAAGFESINWNSLNIEGFITQVINGTERVRDGITEKRDGIAALEKTTVQLKASEASLGALADAIRTGSLVVRLKADAAVHGTATTPDIATFAETTTAHLRRVTGELVAKYRLMPDILKKIEETVAETSGGRSPVMADYYQHWHDRVAASLTSLVTRGLQTLLHNLGGPADTGQGTSHRPNHPVPPPLFRVSAGLVSQNIVVTPSDTDMTTTMTKLIADIQAAAQAFIRWEPGTCIEATPQKLQKSQPSPAAPKETPKHTRSSSRLLTGRTTNRTAASTSSIGMSRQVSKVTQPVPAAPQEPAQLTYHQQVISSPDAQRLAGATMHAVISTIQSILSYLSTFQVYDVFWNPARATIIDGWRQKHGAQLTMDMLEKKLTWYHEKPRSLTELLNVDHVRGFILVNISALLDEIAAEARKWDKDIAAIIEEINKPNLAAMDEMVSTYAADLEAGANPTTFEELQSVLAVIKSVQMDADNTNNAIAMICNAYETLNKHKTGTPAEIEKAERLGPKWVALRKAVADTDAALEPVTAKFISETQSQAAAFGEQLAAFVEEFAAANPADIAEGTSAEMDDAVERLKAYRTRVAELRTRKESIQEAQILFKVDVTEYPALTVIDNQLDEAGQVFDIYTAVQEKIAEWATIAWGSVDMTVLESGVAAMRGRVKKLRKQWKTRNDGVDVDTPALRAVEGVVSNFADSLPLLQDLTSDALRDRHWARLMDVTGKTFDMTGGMTLGALLAMELHNYGDKINEITTAAQKELSIESDLGVIRAAWRQTSFVVVKPSEPADCDYHVLSGVDDITAQVDDHTINLQTMSASRYVAPFATEVHEWEGRLTRVSEVCEVWVGAQTQWLWLRLIFIGAEDIRLQLPDEAKRFDAIDSAFRKIMNDTASNTNVMSACHVDGRYEKLQQLSSQMDRCQKSLTDYLQTKRSSFARFYFISDEELLSVLGTADPRAVQQHMIKLFDNTKKLIFGAGARDTTVVGCESSEGETYDLRLPVLADGPVEVWMGAVQDAMVASIRAITKEGVFHYGSTPRIQWIFDSLGMVTLAGSQVWWTWQVEDVFRAVREGDKHAMKTLTKTLHGQINDLVAQVRRDLSTNDRTKVNTLIVIDVHARDIVDRFVRDSVLAKTEFDWESQMRFYFDRDRDAIVMGQCTGQFDYGYQYMGLASRLVITPLTDRCIMTLTQALTMYLGGSPAGPAGTGKTETVKDLAKHLALSCVVFK